MTYSLPQQTVWLRAVANEARLDVGIVVIVSLLFGSLAALVPSVVFSTIKHGVRIES
jgi:hypothetical protein